MNAYVEFNGIQESELAAAEDYLNRYSSFKRGLNHFSFEDFMSLVLL